MDTNVGKRKPARSTSEWEYSVTNVMDGNKATYFSGAFGQIDATLEFDLQYVRNIAGIEMLFGNNWPTQVKVLYYDEAGKSSQQASEDNAVASML